MWIDIVIYGLMYIFLNYFLKTLLSDERGFPSNSPSTDWEEKKTVLLQSLPPAILVADGSIQMKLCRCSLCNMGLPLNSNSGITSLTVCHLPSPAHSYWAILKQRNPRQWHTWAWLRERGSETAPFIKSRAGAPHLSSIHTFRPNQSSTGYHCLQLLLHSLAWWCLHFLFLILSILWTNSAW